MTAEVTQRPRCLCHLRFLAPREVPAWRQAEGWAGLLHLHCSRSLVRLPVAVGLRTSRRGHPAPALRHPPWAGCCSLPFCHCFPHTVPWASPCTGQDGLEDPEPRLSLNSRRTHPHACRAPSRAPRGLWASNRVDEDSRPRDRRSRWGHVPPLPGLSHTAFLPP